MEIMSTSARSPSKCNKKLTMCPPGHEMRECIDGEGYECIQCKHNSFQPNSVRFGDRCRLRKHCSDEFVEFADYGDTVTDAHCKCVEGYHFENEDQRACVPNRVCGKGYGQGTYGVCVFCLDKQMYSDVEDSKQKCKPLTNCEKDNRCVVKKSNGTFDNVCGPLVRDINDCSSVIKGKETQGVVSWLAIVLGVTGALFVIAILAILLIVCVRRRRQQRRRAQKPLTTPQLEELKNKILETCVKDESLCKKTLSTSFRVIEDRINKQIWSLPQELFKTHYQPGRYEVLVDKYKDSQDKYAINGYLREWRDWKGSTHDAVTHLFQCLGYIKRDDIVFEVCTRLRDEVDITFDAEAIGGMSGKNRAKETLMSEIMDILFPCLKTPSKKDKTCRKAEIVEADTNEKLLEMHSHDQPAMDAKSAGNIYRERTYPSAPAYTEDNAMIVDPSVEGYNRQFSCPVQCTS